jgi:hypothetical protein
VAGRSSSEAFFPMATGFQIFRARAILPFALLALAACSSKNPDTLIGKNVEENSPVMDANASVDANLAASNMTSNPSQANPASGNQINQSSEVSANEPAPKPAATPKPSRSNDVNAARNSANSTQSNDIDNQVPEEPDVPNVSEND